MDARVTIVIAIIIGGLLGMIIEFTQKSKDTKIENVKEFLKFAVAEAEKALGSGTGQLKLRYVYEMTVEKFPWVGSLITFNTFSVWVDEALIWLEGQLNTNKAIQEYVEK